MIPADGCRVYLSTGEASGDAHAAQLARALRRMLPGVSLEGTGGPLMAAAGVHLRHSIASLGASGLWESAQTLPAHIRVLADLRSRFRRRAYDLLVAVDYPGFHLRLADQAARQGIPVLYYIAPQLWAWGLGRAARLAAVTRAVAVILPFEQEFLRRQGVNARFVGHPLLDAPVLPTREQARRTLNLGPRDVVLGLFPGSRRHEVRRMWPVLRDGAHLARRAVPGLRVVVAGVPGCTYAGGDDFQAASDPRFALAAADAAICKSGTTTLEAALADLPMVIAYRMHPLTHAIARRAVRISRIGLANIIAGRDVAPELIQQNATPARVATAVLPLLDRDAPPAKRQRAGFEVVRERLGTPGASGRVAELAAELVA